ncbi:hypothetical protein SBRCBS47491_008063 [Sporothrix bragantina]|uniref:CBM-cenC domain-containing protein n=1 Tax=Sporothrix bragantina TaxID=671064 RepID=A0ABP0CIA8_9PEZI
MVQIPSLAFALAAFSGVVQANPCKVSKVCNSVNVVKDGDFEDTASTAWSLDTGVSIATNSAGAEYATSGTNFAYFDIELRDRFAQYGIAQQLTGLQPNQPYTLQYTFELTDASGIHDGGIEVLALLDGVQVDRFFTYGHDLEGIVTPHTATVTPVSSDPELRISLSGSGSYYYGAKVVLDDISMGLLCSQ